MRDPARIKRILNKIKDLWELEPDTRLCQFLINRLGHHRDLFNDEDDILETQLDRDLTNANKSPKEIQLNNLLRYLKDLEIRQAREEKIHQGNQKQYLSAIAKVQEDIRKLK